MSIIKYNPNQIEFTKHNGNVSESSIVDIDKVLLEINTDVRLKEEAENALASGISYYRLDEKLRNANWSGSMKNGCFVSYSQYVAVELFNYRGFPTHKSFQECQDEILKQVPYVYAMYSEITKDGIVVICKHDNTDARNHEQLCNHIQRDISNRMQFYRVISEYKSLMSYEPDMIINHDCETFHYTQIPDEVKYSKMITKDKFDALGMTPATSLTAILQETRQHFELYRRDFVKAAACYFARRAKQAGFDGSDSYIEFVSRIGGFLRMVSIDICDIFTDVFENNN